MGVSENRLHRVFFDLCPEWGDQAERLSRRLAQEGIDCVSFAALSWKSGSAVPAGNMKTLRVGPALWKPGSVVLTDNPETGAELARRGMVYFGASLCPDADSGSNGSLCPDGGLGSNGSQWFDGAALVLEGFDDIDGRYLEEWMLRAQGLSVTIARTERLTIREIAEQDIEELVRIGGQNGGMAVAGAELDMDASDTPESAFLANDIAVYRWTDVCSAEWLHAYRETAYRLQGFGLWSVLYQGKVIGCCGFEPWGRPEGKEAAEPFTEDKRGTGSVSAEDCLALELQYMLDVRYHRQGFGTEMCQAALDYADRRLGVEEVWLRTRRENLASRALAEKLGFRPEKNGNMISGIVIMHKK